MQSLGYAKTLIGKCSIWALGNIAMFCPQCGTEAPVAARYCMHCGQQLPTNSPAPAPTTPSGGTELHSSHPNQPTLPPAVRWYERKRSVIGIAVLSLLLYSHVLITTLAGATLRGNDAIYISAWTALVCYVVFKRKKWSGWLGAAIGFVSGVALVFVAAVASGLNR